MKRLYTFLSISFFICFNLMDINAQTLTIGNGTFINSNVAGPAYTSTIAGSHSRYAYIFPESVLTTLKHGDSIRAFSFLKNGIGSLNGTCSMKIYVRNTTLNNYGNRNVVWNTQINLPNMELKYSKNPILDITNNPGWCRFAFDTPYFFDTLDGKNLEVLIEYHQTNTQNANIFWTYENGNTVMGYSVNQTKFSRVNGTAMPDSTNSNSDIHPTIRIEFPKNDFEVIPTKIFSLGKIPVPLGNPDTVKAILWNVGKLTATNFKVYIISKGANNLIDSANFTLQPNEEKLFNMPLIYPTNYGLDTIEIRVAESNNSLSVVRLANENVYSYRDVSQPIAGGIGFNGATGDFVAKFFSNSQKAINQITVNFSGSNQKFRLGIWAVNPTTGAPGTNLWTSDTLTSSPTFITPVSPFVTVNGSFFVGVRQIGTQNVAFGYQPETPTRTRTFFYTSPTGATNWVDFSPQSPFKFAIEPRLQKANDVAPIALVNPNDTINLNISTTIAPKARIINYGSNNQLTPFTTTLIISRNNFVEYTSDKSDTISSGRTRIITFDSSFNPTVAGDYDVLIITRLGNDEQKDNDTFRTKIIVARFDDVGLGSVFDPSNSFDYEQFQDTIYPTIFVQNFGQNPKGPFNVTAKIYDSLNNEVYSDTKPYSVGPLNSVLANFKPFPCSLRGDFTMVAYTELVGDANRSNDTVKIPFTIIRSNDVAVTVATYPANLSSLTPPVSSRRPEVVVENLGDANQDDPFKVYCEIFYNNIRIFYDSSSTNSYKNIPNNVFFGFFQPTLNGYYTMKVYTNMDIDQYRLNDTIYSNFAVGVPDDIQIVSIDPISGSKFQINTAIEPKATFINNGFISQTTLFPVRFKVFDASNNQVYSSTKMITLDSGETKQVTFDNTLFFANNGTYKVVAFTNLSKDFVKSNDTIIGEYFAQKNFDVALFSIVNPKNNDSLMVGLDELIPMVTLINLGDSLHKTSFITNFRIYNNQTNALLYNQNNDTFFSNNNPINLSFPKFAIQNNEITIRCEAFLTSFIDQSAANNSQSNTAKYYLFNDLWAKSILLPANNVTYSKSSAAVLPRITIENRTPFNSDIVKANLKIYRQDTVTNIETIVHSDSIEIQGMSGNELLTINLGNSFSFNDKEAGKYNCSLSVVSNKDQVSTNNIQSSTFRISESLNIYSLLTDKIRISPNPANDVIEIIIENNNEKLNAELYDSKGRLVNKISSNESVIQFNVSDLSSGLYFIQINNQRFKIIVSH
jgi:hypothetical protein